MSDHGKGGSYVISPGGEKVLVHRTGQAVAELPATAAAEGASGAAPKAKTTSARGAGSASKQKNEVKA